MSIRDLEPPPFHIEKFDHSWRTWLNNVFEQLQTELKPGLFFSSGTHIDLDDSPYTMVDEDEIIHCDTTTGVGSPGVITLFLVEGEDKRLVHVKNEPASGSLGVLVFPKTGSGNLIEPFVGGIPSTSLFLASGNSASLFFDETRNAWFII